MVTYTGYIVDDESLARYALRNKLKAHPEIEIIGEADGLPSALQEIPRLCPDILFLDIQLNEGTGFDLLDRMDYSGKVVFITAFDSYALRAFEINAVDYLLKPISRRRLKESLRRVTIQGIERNLKDIPALEYEDRILVSTSATIKFIRLKEIILIKSSGDYAEIRLYDGNKHLDSRPMRQWEQSLPDNHFCRISRFHIVNFDYITRIDKGMSSPGLLFLEGYDEPFRISKAYYQRIRLRYL
jgi:two-component system, LytTR family, response regulator